MRKKCTKKRSKMPDSLFVQMVLECYYPWLMELENLNEDFPKSLMDNEDDDDNYGFDEEEDYEDDLTRAQRGAGFYMDDDGECQYVDDIAEDEENYEDSKW